MVTGVCTAVLQDLFCCMRQSEYSSTWKRAPVRTCKGNNKFSALYFKLIASHSITHAVTIDLSGRRLSVADADRTTPDSEV